MADKLRQSFFAIDFDRDLGCDTKQDTPIRFFGDDLAASPLTQLFRERQSSSTVDVDNPDHPFSISDSGIQARLAAVGHDVMKVNQQQPASSPGPLSGPGVFPVPAIVRHGPANCSRAPFGQQVPVAVRPGLTTRRRAEQADLGHPVVRGEPENFSAFRCDKLNESHQCALFLVPKV